MRQLLAGWPKLMHRAADRLDVRLRPLLARSDTLRAAWVRVIDGIVAQQTDRRYMSRHILPALADAGFANLLFVGVRGYTRAYEAAFARGRTTFWTSDIDPAAERYGAKGHHLVGDIAELDRMVEPGTFDAVILNGIFGWGVDDPEAMEEALSAIHAALAEGGVLLIGWNHDRSPDPDTLDATGDLFSAEGFAGLPPRKDFPDVTHVYSWYRRR